MEYKRLTERRGKLVIDKCQNCENVSNPQGCTDKQCYEIMKNRLVELEDKIENGTLLELPCKVGDKFYQVVKGLPVYEWEVETITFSNIYFPKNYVITARRSKDLAFWKFWSEDFGVTIFFTREEAEKRLKDIQQ